MKQFKMEKRKNLKIQFNSLDRIRTTIFLNTL